MAPSTQQTQLHEYSYTQTPNLPPAGDQFPPKHEDGIIQFAFQNIHGATLQSGVQVAPEIDALLDWDINIMGMSETNRPWTPKQKSVYDYMMDLCFSSSRTIYTSAAPPDHLFTSLPGGNLLTINGHTTGRICGRGSDPLGRFCWTTLRGRQDEGVIVITAYRVCHESYHNPGSFTAYQQQFTGLLKAGHSNPSPRRQILTDLLSLMRTHRAKGFRPILMMDANGDYRGDDKYFASFVDEAGLDDPFYDKFQISPPTYIRGTRRLDYIFIDPALSPALVRIGYLGTHDGALLDHVMMLADFDECKLFAGILNRPPPRHSREILIEQTDKVQAFMLTLLPRLKESNIQQRVYDLAPAFSDTGPTDANIALYHDCYSLLLALARNTASEVGRKKFGYMRSPALTSAGRTLNAYIMLLDCKTRNALPSPALTRICSSLDLDATQILSTTDKQTLRRRVRECHARLWDTQKHCKELRYEWLEKTAQDRAQAAGDPDWEKKLTRMKHTALENATNRKLSILTKGRKGSLDRIQIPTGTWYLSPSKAEIYHYDSRVFEAYPEADSGTYHPYHTIKVPSTDAVRIEVTFDTDRQLWVPTLLTDKPMQWEDVVQQEDLESALLKRNERHLRQTEREAGISTRPPLTTI
jgi:hypothetical protein